MLTLRSKKNRDGERDVSEKIALGLPNAGASSETMYDARLFDGEGVSLRIFKGIVFLLCFRFLSLKKKEIC